MGMALGDSYEDQRTVGLAAVLLLAQLSFDAPLQCWVPTWVLSLLAS